MSAKITTKSIRKVVPRCKSRLQILKSLGAAPTASNYDRLERIAIESGITIPEINKTGKRASGGIWDRETLSKAAASSGSLREMAKKFGLSEKSDDSVARAAKRLGIKLPSGRSPEAWAAKRTPEEIKRRLEKRYATYIRQGVKLEGRQAKSILCGLGLLKEECSVCRLGTTWQGKPIVLQLDHINGNNTDNRIENLRIICPNCHSQTHTYAGRNKGSGSIRYKKTK